MLFPSFSKIVCFNGMERAWLFIRLRIGAHLDPSPGGTHAGYATESLPYAIYKGICPSMFLSLSKIGKKSLFLGYFHWKYLSLSFALKNIFLKYFCGKKKFKKDKICPFTCKKTNFLRIKFWISSLKEKKYFEFLLFLNLRQWLNPRHYPCIERKSILVNEINKILSHI